MNLICKMSGHQWQGCRCTRCGETRDTGHRWDGAGCTVCGKQQPLVMKLPQKPARVGYDPAAYLASLPKIGERRLENDNQTMVFSAAEIEFEPKGALPRFVVGHGWCEFPDSRTPARVNIFVRNVLCYVNTDITVSDVQGGVYMDYLLDFENYYLFISRLGREQRHFQLSSPFAQGIADQLRPDGALACFDATRHPVQAAPVQPPPQPAPTPVRAPPTPQPQALPVDYRTLADKLAHYQTFSMDESEADAMEEQLLAGGSPALDAVVAALLSYASGRAEMYWWNNARRLVRLIRRFDGADHKTLLERLVAQPSNVWEYEQQVKDVAREELLAIKQNAQPQAAGALVPDEDAGVVLNKTGNLGLPQARLEALFKLRPDSEGWSDKNKAYYYFLHAGAARALYPQSKAPLAFYAAQVFYNPDPNAFGWGQFSVLPSEENAKALHRQYPLPTTLEEVAAYVDPAAPPARAGSPSCGTALATGPIKIQEGQ